MYLSLVLAAIPATRGANPPVLQIEPKKAHRFAVEGFAFVKKAMSKIPLHIQSLEKETHYKVSQTFTDFYQNLFHEGETLTFVELHLLPHHGGYTIVFKERRLYLQEQENASVLNSLGDYLRRADEE